MTNDAVFDNLFTVIALKFCQHQNGCYEQSEYGCTGCWKAKAILSILQERSQ